MNKKTTCAVLLLVSVVAGCAEKAPYPYANIETSKKLRINDGDESGRVPFRYSTTRNWSQYKNVIIDPVVVYSGKDSQFDDVDDSEKKQLSVLMDKEFRSALAEDFSIINAPQPNTLRLRLILTGAEKSTPFLSTFSRFDLGFGVYNIVNASRDKKGTFTGSVYYAVEIYDASNSRLLETYVTHQYPKVYNIGSTFGSLTAAQAGITRGATELAERLSNNK